MGHGFSKGEDSWGKIRLGDEGLGGKPTARNGGGELLGEGKAEKMGDVQNQTKGKARVRTGNGRDLKSTRKERLASILG